MGTVITYKNEKGGISVIYPIDSARKDLEPYSNFIQRVIAESVPSNSEYLILDESNLPKDRSFRDAWGHEGEEVKIDLKKAVEIKKNQIRAERAPLLSKLDVDLMKALESPKNDSTDISAIELIKTKKQSLRDATAHPKLNNPSSIDELKTITINDLV